MPLQNRVDPWGAIHAVKSRGAFLGNRGIIHNPQKEIITTHRTQGWVTCRLNFKGRKQKIMEPGSYTQLFFLDEATAFSAGHRPCAECRRERYNEFKAAWIEVNSQLLKDKPPISTNIDRIIHRERINRKQKVTYTDSLDALPDGTMIEHDSHAYLVWKDNIFQWSFFGYTPVDVKQIEGKVVVLTPRSYVRMFSKEFVPGVHESL